MAFWKKLLTKNSKYRKKRRSRAEIWAFKVADLIFPKDSESFVRSQKFLLELELQTFSRFRPFTIVYQLQPRKFCLFRARTQTCYIPLERAWNLVSNEPSTSLFGPGLVTWQPDEWILVSRFHHIVPFVTPMIGLGVRLRTQKTPTHRLRNAYAPPTHCFIVI